MDATCTSAVGERMLCHSSLWPSWSWLSSPVSSSASLTSLALEASWMACLRLLPLQHHTLAEPSSASPPSASAADAAAVAAGEEASPLLLLTVALAAAAVAVVVWQWVRYSGSKYMARMCMWPVVGSLPLQLYHFFKGDLHDFFARLVQARDDMTVIGAVPGMGMHEVVTANPAVLQHILKDNFDNYVKGQQLQEVFGELLGHGIFTSDGQLWRQQRKMASYEFSARSLRQLLLTSVHSETVQRLIPILDEACESGTAVDMQDVLLRFTFDNICQVAFGYDPSYLAPGLPHQPFASAFDAATRIGLLRSLLPAFVWKTMRFFSLGWEKDLKRAVEVVNDLTHTVIAQRKQQLQLQQQQQQLKQNSNEDSQNQAAIDNVEMRPDLLTRMMLLVPAAQAEGAIPAGEVAQERFLREMCVSFIIAGRDTSSVGLTWLLWLLATHEHVQDKVLAELRRVEASSGDNAAEADGSFAPFTHEQLRQMTYTHATILESLRLYPPAPLDFKWAKGGDMLPDGTRVHAGWRVSYSIYAMGRMTRLWGADALQFKPERWIDGNGEVRVESPFKYSVFNGGPRMCLGREFALLQMKSLTSTILRRYRLSLVAGHRVEYRISTSLFMKHGLHMSLTRREETPL